MPTTTPSRQMARDGRSIEDLFFALAVDDLQKAADLFAPIHEATGGVDGWVSLEVSPLLVNDTRGTIQAAASLHAQAAPQEPVHQDPGYARGHPGDRGIDLPGHPGQRDAAVLARAVPGRGRGLHEGHRAPPQRRQVAGGGVGGVGVRQPLGRRRRRRRCRPNTRTAWASPIAMRTYKAYRELLASERWKKLAAAGAHPQRLLWASTGTKDPKALARRCTSRRWPRPTPSTRCPRRR